MSAPEIKLGNAKGRIERIYEYMRKHKPDQPGVTSDGYKIRQEALETSYKEFNKYHDEVTVLQSLSTEVTEEDVNEHAALYISMEEMVFQLKEDILHAFSALSNKIKASDVPLFDSSIVNQVEVRLSPITITPFSGDHNEWTAFHAMFLSMVHYNASLQKVQKLQYLKSLLKDEAIQLIRHIPITTENYEVAWEKLKSRYDKKNRIVNQLVTPQVNYSKIQSTKSNNGSCTSACQSTTEHSSSAEVRRPQLSFQSSSFSNQLSTSSSSQSTNTFQPIQTGHSRRPEVCSLCNDGGHRYLFQCKRFRELEVKSRREVVREHNYCFNCLFTTHSVKDCPSSYSCQVCKRRHHTLIHEDEEPQATAAFAKSCHTSQCVAKTMGLLPIAEMKCQDQYGNLQEHAVVKVDQPFNHYNLNTVAYGTASAPYQATKSLNQLGKENGTIYSVAPKIIQESIDVDEQMTGGATPEIILKVQPHVNEIKSTAGVQLIKSSAAHQELLKDIQEDLRVLDIKDVDQGSKVVGTPVTKITKRTILSDASRLFMSESLQLPEPIQVPRWLPSPLQSTIEVFIKVAQASAFSAEVKVVANGWQSSSKSKLVSLHPFLDRNRFLRVSGCLQHSSAYLVQRPFTLPIHLLYKCVNCARRKVTIGSQLTGILPTERITPSRPCPKVGVDYAEPDTAGIEITRQDCWKFRQKVLIEFLTRWSREYISSLQVRINWNYNRDYLTIGVIVVVQEYELSPANYSMAQISDVHSGSDDIVRVVTITGSSRDQLKKFGSCQSIEDIGCFKGGGMFSIGHISNST